MGSFSLSANRARRGICLQLLQRGFGGGCGRFRRWPEDNNGSIQGIQLLGEEDNYSHRPRDNNSCAILGSAYLVAV